MSIIPLYSEAINHGFTAQQINNEWTAGTFLFFGGLTFLLLALGALHIIHNLRNKIFLSRTFEFFVVLVLFYGPTALEREVHIHHYFLGWICGMNVNLRQWWSFTVLAIFWGVYLNGVASWGRDTFLGCDEAIYRGDGGCSFFGNVTGSGLAPH